MALCVCDTICEIGRAKLQSANSLPSPLPVREFYIVSAPIDLVFLISQQDVHTANP